MSAASKTCACAVIDSTSSPYQDVGLTPGDDCAIVRDVNGIGGVLYGYQGDDALVFLETHGEMLDDTTPSDDSDWIYGGPGDDAIHVQGYTFGVDVVGRRPSNSLRRASSFSCCLSTLLHMSLVPRRAKETTTSSKSAVDMYMVAAVTRTCVLVIQSGYSF